MTLGVAGEQDFVCSNPALFYKLFHTCKTRQCHPFGFFEALCNFFLKTILIHKDHFSGFSYFHLGKKRFSSLTDSFFKLFDTEQKIFPQFWISNFFQLEKKTFSSNFWRCVFLKVHWAHHSRKELVKITTDYVNTAS